MNLQILKRSRKSLRAGDVFVVKPKDREFYFGLVVNPLVKIRDLMGSIADESWDGALVYIYDQHAPKKDMVPDLDLGKLLTPPLILELGAWRSGYAETVGKIEPTADQVLSRHCFHEVVRDEYLDEYGDPLPRRFEPCGIYGLTPAGGLDNEISRALGLSMEAE